jgi:hypothetical protein
MEDFAMRQLRIATFAAAVGLAGIACSGDGPSSPSTTGTIVGTVQDDAFSPVVGATVRLRNSGGTSNLRTDVTDANGAYSFSNLDPGDYDVNVAVPGTYVLDGQVNPIPKTVQAGVVATADFRLRLLAGSIQGVVADTSGTPVQGATAALRAPGTTVDVMTRTTDAAGNYSFARVAKGDWDVFLRVAVGTRVEGGNPARVTVTDGNSSSLNFSTSPITATVSFATDVMGVFNAYCNNCHTAGGAPAQLNLDPGAAYANTVNVPATELNSMNRIEPGDPDNSYLINKLQNTHVSVGGSGSFMPPSGTLPQATIDLMRTWVTEGALNN